MSELYLPPEGLPFRLYADEYKRVLFSSDHGDPRFGVVEPEPAYGDQFWRLIRGTGEYEGYYKFKSERTGLNLFSRTPEPHVGVYEDGYSDQWFKLEQGSGQRKSSFRILNYAGDRVLFVKDGHVNNYAEISNVYDDQYFHFDFHDMEIIGITYHVDRGEILASAPQFIGEETLINDSETNQSMVIHFSKAVAVEYSFEHSHGFSITVGASGKVGIPFVAEGEIRTEVSTQHTLTWGQSTREEVEISMDFPVVCLPNSTVKCTANATCSNLEVPFTIKSRSTTTGIVVETDGVYHGVSYWGVTSTIKQGGRLPTKPK